MLNTMAQHVSQSEEDYVGDEEILRLINETQVAFLAGDKSKLFRCLYLCARFQAVIPEWAVDAVLKLEEDMERGKIKDFNDAFGVSVEQVNTRAARARKMEAKAHVLEELWRLRRDGRSLNDAEIFSEALENLRQNGLNVNHRDIKEIYDAEGAFLKDIPRQAEPNHGFGFAYLTMPKARRRGRGILRDEEAG